MSLGTLLVIIGIVIAVIALFVTVEFPVLAIAVICIGAGVLVGANRLVK